jgi:3-oxoacyl-[acyl-carrier-protein] synthase II
VKEVVIAKTAINTSLGDSLAETGENLYLGKTAIRPLEQFDVSQLDFKQAAWKDQGKQLPGWSAAPNRVCSLLIPVLTALGSLPEKTNVIWCGIKGNAEFIVAYNEQEQKPQAPHLAADYSAWVKDYLQLTGDKFEINAACASSTVGIIYGAHMIACGQAQTVLVCAADIVSRFTQMGFAALKALTPTRARPFDQNRDGLNLGDGAVAILLADRETAAKMAATELYTLKGWGISNDANHITGPARNGSGLIAAIHQTLKRAQLGPEAVAAFCTHGTGTVYNDAMELTALEAVFGTRRFPVFSVKGSLGHTLGAAGGIETALCCLALKAGCIPPTVGVENPEERACGRVAPATQPLPDGALLTTNSGFGGVNASLLITKEPA